MKPSFSEVWKRICTHQGETFRLAKGKQITYTIDGDMLNIDNSNSRARASQFEHALDMVPVSGPGVFNKANLWGPSYLYAIMMDARISKGQW